MRLTWLDAVYLIAWIGLYALADAFGVRGWRAFVLLTLAVFGGQTYQAVSTCLRERREEE